MNLDNIRFGLDRVANYLRSGDPNVTGYSRNELSQYLTVRRYGELVLFNYTNAAQYRADWNNFLRVCRGLVLDSNGRIVSFPFHKFFNINEYPETDIQMVSRWSLRSITEKLDGVMIQVFLHEGELVFASRHGIWTRAAKLAKELAVDIEAITSRFDFPFTLICELIHPEIWQPGMVQYEQDLKLLVPLFVRNLNTLELIPAHEVLGDLPAPYGFAQRYQYNSIQDLVRVASSYQDADWEGVVVQGMDECGNQLVKVKSFGYIKRLQIIRGLSPRRLIQVYVQYGMDTVRYLITSLEEVVLAVPVIRSTIELLEQEESRLREEIQRYMLPKDRVMEVPEEWRWVVSYQGTPKLEMALRSRVANRVNSIIQPANQDEDSELEG